MTKASHTIISSCGWWVVRNVPNARPHTLDDAFDEVVILPPSVKTD